MPTFEDEQQQLEDGAASWQDRLSAQIDLVSPSGVSYIAKWRGDPRRKEKRVGIFEFQGVDGSLVQDHGSAGSRMPLTLYFDGPDHDLVAANFYVSCDEKGPWTITHPVHGFFELQLLSIEEDTQPVENGNYTKFVTEWIEPLDEETLQTARQLYGIVDQLIAELNAQSAQSFVDDAELDTFAKESAVAKTAERQIASTADILDPLAAGNDDIADAVAAARATVEDVVSVTPLDTEALAGALQAAFQKPALGTDDIDERTDAYDSVTETLAEDLPESATTDAAEQRNSSVTTQINMLSGLAASALAVTTGATQTRQQAVDKATQLIDQYESITDSLDSVQQAFEDLPIDSQFFSMTETYTTAGSMVTAVVKFLLISSYDLAIEKRFILKYPSTPAAIAIEQYGSLGDSDGNIDKVIAANDLTGDDVLYLPSGREVVVYV